MAVYPNDSREGIRDHGAVALHDSHGADVDWDDNHEGEACDDCTRDEALHDGGCDYRARGDVREDCDVHHDDYYGGCRHDRYDDHCYHPSHLLDDYCPNVMTLMMMDARALLQWHYCYRLCRYVTKEYYLHERSFATISMRVLHLACVA